MTNQIKDGWEITPSNIAGGPFQKDRKYLEEEFKEDWPLVYKEQLLIYDLLKLLITGDCGYYFNEIHEHEQPEELNNLEWKRVYHTPRDYYKQSGEYNTVDVAYTEDYTYYAISLHGCSFSSALTEYVRVAKL